MNYNNLNIITAAAATMASNANAATTANANAATTVIATKTNFNENEIEKNNNVNEDFTFIEFDNFFNQTPYKLLEKQVKKILKDKISFLNCFVRINTVMFNIKNLQDTNNVTCITQIFKKNQNNYYLLEEMEGISDSHKNQYLYNIGILKSNFILNDNDFNIYNDFEKTFNYIKNFCKNDYFTNLIHDIIVINGNIIFIPSAIQCDNCKKIFIYPFQIFFHSKLANDYDLCEDCFNQLENKNKINLFYEQNLTELINLYFGKSTILIINSNENKYCIY